MAMYYYASKISAIACGTRCRQSVLQKSRGQRDRDKFTDNDDDEEAFAGDCDGGGDGGADGGIGVGDGDDEEARHHRTAFDGGGAGAYSLSNLLSDPASTKTSTGQTARAMAIGFVLPGMDGVRYRRRHSEQLDAYDIAMAFHNIEVSGDKSNYDCGQKPMASEVVQYDVPRNVYNQLEQRTGNCDVNYQNSVLGSGGIMYINGKIVSGPLEPLLDSLLPKNLVDLDKEFIFSFLLSSRLFLRPHELLGKLLSSVPDCESLDTLVALLAEWTNKFPYDYRDERMMNHVKHIVARCSSTRLEVVVSEILSVLLKRLTDLERHEEDLRACQTTTAGGDKSQSNTVKSLECPTSSHYAQILCRLEKKLAKHIGPEEFLQCSSNILLDKQKKWDQPSSTGGPPGAQDPKKTCNLETYLDWSARLRLFVCNEILRCSGIRDRSKTVELWSGVAQYCLLVGNYNSATAILETLESPPIARLKITWSKLQVTCQQLDCMQRHAEGHGDLWHKQASVLNENHQHHHQQQQQQQKHPHHAQQKTEVATAAVFLSSLTASASTSANVSASPSMVTTTTTASAIDILESQQKAAVAMAATSLAGTKAGVESSDGDGGDGDANAVVSTPTLLATTTTGLIMLPVSNATDKLMGATNEIVAANAAYHDKGGGGSTNTLLSSNTITNSFGLSQSLSNNNINNKKGTTTTTSSSPIDGRAAGAAGTQAKPNDWVVIPVFADIVKLALAGREDCLQRLPNGHINVVAFDRMAAIVGAFTKHMHAVKQAPEMPPGEYEMFCRHMQKASQLNESELMMASFDCEEPNNAEKLMYDLN